ncbi:hypothetical protein GALMADRAFT_63312 [Galerina marginata CBS 339.88]|uniref:Uncharacterized protein n=1 Tax=Galerina marginata (strain CBS 339.88) TaxID=685588 RepID=A0A067TB81_GALM3|nr:hypothetical protein GALMADRAFT_63312 [Galerina marginata CBS 339.88]
MDSGLYIITSKMEEFPVGRNAAEDLSLNPKKVIILPKGIEAPRWILQKVSDDTFIMKAGGNYTANIDDKLFAVLMDEPRPTLWKVDPQFHLGENTYTVISGENPRLGWVVLDIAVRPLIVQPSFPPRFPPQELFVITRLDRGD